MEGEKHVGLLGIRAWSLRARAVLILGLALLYVLAVVLLHRTLGFGATPLAILPVAVAGWVFGLQGGLVCFSS